MNIKISLPLDEDGYLDRSCPICERHFRWHDGPVGEVPSDAPETGSYYCPYCGEQSQMDAWWTREQVENMQRTAAAAVMPELTRELRETTNRISQSGFLKVKVSGIDIAAPVPLAMDKTEAMVAVASPCHPYEPTKITTEWLEPIHCLVCGERFTIPTR